MRQQVDQDHLLRLAPTVLRGVVGGTGVGSLGGLQTQHVGQTQADQARTADTQEFTTAEAVTRRTGLSWNGDHGSVGI